jgi:molybdate transport system substrate-binding protein
MRFPILPSLASLGLSLLGIGLGACGSRTPAPAPEPLRVFAAASTAEWVGELARSAPGEVAEPSFGATSDLARQISEGAPADLLVAASPVWPQRLEELGLTSGPGRVVARNRLVLATAAKGELAGQAPADLAELLSSLGNGDQLAIAVEGVPAGDYARAAIASLGLQASATPRLVGMADVRAVLRAVERGETAAGFIYASDARAAAVEVLLAFDPALHPPIEYVAVSVAKPERAALAEAFIERLLSPQSRERLIELGFEPGP